MATQARTSEDLTASYFCTSCKGELRDRSRSKTRPATHKTQTWANNGRMWTEAGQIWADVPGKMTPEVYSHRNFWGASFVRACLLSKAKCWILTPHFLKAQVALVPCFVLELQGGGGQNGSGRLDAPMERSSDAKPATKQTAYGPTPRPGLPLEG